MPRIAFPSVKVAKPATRSRRRELFSQASSQLEIEQGRIYAVVVDRSFRRV
jgi:hypothetical protein